MKWVPLSFYDNNGTIYLVSARRKRSGIIVFNTKRVTPLIHSASINIPRIDVNESWKEVISSEKGGGK